MAGETHQEMTVYSWTPVDAEEAQAEELSSQMVFMRAVTRSGSKVRGKGSLSAHRLSVSAPCVRGGGGRRPHTRSSTDLSAGAGIDRDTDRGSVGDMDMDRDREGRILPLGEEYGISTGTTVGHCVGRVLDTYIQAADTAAYALMGALSYDQDTSTSINTKKRKNTLDCGSDSRVLITGSSDADLDLDSRMEQRDRGERDRERDMERVSDMERERVGDRDRDREGDWEEEGVLCSSPQTLIRNALEANHRVNGRLLELARRYQEDLGG